MPLHVDLNKLRDVVKNDAVYDKLVAKVNSIDTSGFVLKTKYDADKSELQKKFMILVGLLKKETAILKLLK